MLRFLLVVRITTVSELLENDLRFDEASTEITRSVKGSVLAPKQAINARDGNQVTNMFDMVAIKIILFCVHARVMTTDISPVYIYSYLQHEFQQRYSPQLLWLMEKKIKKIRGQKKFFKYFWGIIFLSDNQIATESQIAD